MNFLSSYLPVLAACAACAGHPSASLGLAVASPTSADMIRFDGGPFVMGDGASDAPLRSVRLSPFLLAATEVTNAQFAAFVAATGYVTDAEQAGGGLVFRDGDSEFQFVAGACWRAPHLGSGAVRPDHPVVLVSWHDASAYARWAELRLPTEAEWEFAAREGRAAPKFNYWEGEWPHQNLVQDGFFYTAPVASYQPASTGVYDLIGNVWEWNADWYAADAYDDVGRVDPAGPEAGELRVVRGGSWFCSENYCGAYRPGFRGKSPPRSSFNNVGFRCAADVPGDSR